MHREGISLKIVIEDCIVMNTMNDTVHTIHTHTIYTQELRSKLSLRNDEVENLTNINRELKKLFKQDPNATQPEKVYFTCTCALILFPVNCNHK